MLVKRLVVDSGGFINNAPIREISENVYTLSEVVSEIKDKATKQRLQVLPYELHIVDPPAEDIAFVTEFSKKTGDYPSLSATDIKLLALAVHLHSQYGKTPLNTAVSNLSWQVERRAQRQDIVGFYKPSSNRGGNMPSDNTQVNSSDVVDGAGDVHDYALKEDEDDDSGWITPETLSTALENMGSLTTEEENSEVGCITTDFAMQNVIIQLGLPALSTKGLLIREARTFVLRCHACFHVTSIMTKKFCPRCGNQTLKRVSVSIGSDGQRKLHMNFRRPVNIKGFNQSLPMPKGGKHANDPVLCEDQPCPHNRPKKFDCKVNPLDPDYEARSSPFAFHDVHSRSAQLRTNVKRKSRK